LYRFIKRFTQRSTRGQMPNAWLAVSRLLAG
jgi:hypothetical protein